MNFQHYGASLQPKEAVASFASGSNLEARKDFTVAICTYNGAKRLPNVLEQLRCQIDTDSLSWEIIVVDNNSSDNTALVVQEYQANWPSAYPLKYYFEPEQGLAFARRCAIAKAQSSLIGFLDDDNVPASNWVAAAYAFSQAHPKAGAYGGQIHGDFEGELPEGFQRIARFFALIEGNTSYCYNHKYPSNFQRMFPPGAGIVIRKEAWLESIRERPVLCQFGEDIEMLSRIWQKGWEIWFNPDMQIRHEIPKSRLEKDYLMRFFWSHGLSRYQMRILNYKPWQRFLTIPAHLANDLRRIILHIIKYRRVLKTDLIAACELQLLLGIFISPFYHWQELIVRNLTLQLERLSFNKEAEAYNSWFVAQGSMND
ncbi:MAG TPA: glycosyl transferase [Cyanobacteria bacterium UBA8803]|nr:glycosyl transferase [Cyanobacteria bacterium UBA9273]HBL60635.1 glycosyl transferase [Cyanobacteria bacterium UBA8803]